MNPLNAQKLFPLEAFFFFTPQTIFINLMISLTISMGLFNQSRTIGMYIVVGGEIKNKGYQRVE